MGLQLRTDQNQEKGDEDDSDFAGEKRIPKKNEKTVHIPIENEKNMDQNSQAEKSYKKKKKFCS